MPDLTVPVLEAWISHYSEDPYIIEQMNSLKSLHDDVFNKQKVAHLDYSKDIPENFTKELYIATFRKIWATIRHDIYLELKAKKKESRSDGPVPEDEFQRVYDEVHKRFESIRTDIYEMMTDTTDLPAGKAREIMQKAYVTYSTVTHLSKDSEEAVRSRWADQVNVILKNHGEYMM